MHTPEVADITAMRKILLLITIITATLCYSHDLDGIASWYGGKFVGRQTANGEIFDTTKLTAAHKTLPFNTIVEVKNLDNNKTIEVRINDRGPFIDGRVIDLSKKAAEKIDMLNSGTAKVSLKIKDMPIPPQVSDIQVGAFGNLINVKNFKKRLVDAGFKPSTTMTNKGIIRVMLKGVPISKTFETVLKLESMGIEKVVITQRS